MDLVLLIEMFILPFTLLRQKKAINNEAGKAMTDDFLKEGKGN